MSLLLLFAGAPAPVGGGRTGSLDQTLGAVTVVATGRLAISGTLSRTLGACTLVATGTGVGIEGELTATLGSLTLQATGTGTLAVGRKPQTVAIRAEWIAPDPSTQIQADVRVRGRAAWRASRPVHAARADLRLAGIVRCRAAEPRLRGHGVSAEPGQHIVVVEDDDLVLAPR